MYYFGNYIFYYLCLLYRYLYFNLNCIIHRFLYIVIIQCFYQARQVPCFLKQLDE